MFYAQSTGGFYDREINGDNIPADAVEITAEEHVALLEGQSQGKMIAADENGYPILQDPPQPTADQMADTARAERNRLIESVRWRIERHNDEVALGSEPSEPLEPLLQYTQALRDVPQQAGFPGDIDWPVNPLCAAMKGAHDDGHTHQPVPQVPRITSDHAKNQPFTVFRGNSAPDLPPVAKHGGVIR